MRDELTEKERWSSGASYEAYVGRWSTRVSREFISWLDVPPASLWLDAGCGTGALTRTILERATPSAVVGVDQSPPFVAFARERTRHPAAGFVAGDATALPLADNAFGAAVSGLVLNFVSDPSRMIAEMARVTHEGGRVAVYVWDYAGEMQMMRYFWAAAVELDAAARDLDEGARFSVCNPDRLAALAEGAGLTAVQVRAIDVDTEFQDFDDYWSPFLGGTGTAPTYVSLLSDEGRSALRERIRQRLPTGPDGRIRLIARALAVQGTISAQRG